MRILSVLAAGLVVSTATLAAPPLSTLNADVPGVGNCNADFRLSSYRLRGAGFKASDEGFGLGLSCGLTAKTEIGADFNYVDGDLYGLGLTGKWQFWSANGGALALTGRVDTARFPGSDGMEYVGSTVGLAYTQRWNQRHEVHANAALSVPDEGDNQLGLALAYGYQFAPAWTALAEASKVEDSAAVWGAGLRWQASRDWQLGLLVNQSKDQGVRARELRLSARLSF